MSPAAWARAACSSCCTSWGCCSGSTAEAQVLSRSLVASTSSCHLGSQAASAPSWAPQPLCQQLNNQSCTNFW